MARRIRCWDHLRAMLPHSNRRFIGEELCTRISHMLGLAVPPTSAGQPLPQGWHSALIDCATPRGLLRRDGFPGLGVPMPDIALPRLVAGGRKVSFNRPLTVGNPVARTSVITEVKHKQGAGGPIALVSVDHAIRETDGELAMAAEPAIAESQTYILLDAPYDAQAARHLPAPPDALAVKAVRPDQTMLFQFSALSFNSHKIHLDRDYAREVEGYPDLVVNGGLTTLLMTEIARCELGLRITSLAVRNHAPLFCDREIAFLVQAGPAGADRTRILAADDNGSIAAEMEIEHHAI